MNYFDCTHNCKRCSGEACRDYNKIKLDPLIELTENIVKKISNALNNYKCCKISITSLTEESCAPIVKELLKEFDRDDLIRRVCIDNVHHKCLWDMSIKNS